MSGGSNHAGNPRVDVRNLSVQDLLAFFADILDELNSKGVLKSQNNPVADYTEWLVAQKLGLRLERNSRRGYDATDSKGTRYQIKGRRIHPTNSSRQLSVIRNLEVNEFEFLIGVIFNRDFSVLEAYRIPRTIVEKYSRYNRHQNGHILRLEGEILSHTGVDSIREEVSRPAKEEPPYGP